MDPDIPGRLKRLLVEHLLASEDQITPDATFEKLGADSLDRLELAIIVEEEFGFEIEDEACEKLRTVGDVIELLESLDRAP